ncbi:MAG: PD-(D/E)XK nuclease family protein [Deltaproteobacteria bacterium]|nr:PD-(D/E)XK nuclease family protein [Deltaproteobacteria bacterium]
MRSTFFETRPELFAALARGDAAIVTATERLARELERQFNEAQRAAGRRLWTRPQLRSLSGWLEGLWSALLEEGSGGAAPLARLSAAAELALWERAIRRSALGPELLGRRATAKVAAEAWHLVQHHQVSLPRVRRLADEEGVAFAGWAEAFEAACRKGGWLDRARLCGALTERVRTGALRFPAELGLAGFDELTPAELELLGALETRGVRVSRLDGASAGRASVEYVAAADPRGELEEAARWARARLEAGEAGPFGIVVPDLVERRREVEWTFADLLDPGWALAARRAGEGLFDVSLGESLADAPLVATALGLLGLEPHAAPLEATGGLLRSPFVGGAALEGASRAALEAELRRTGRFVVDLPAVVPEVGRAGSQAFACPLLGPRVAEWTAAFETLPARQAASSWAASFAALLDALGWPGERSRTSVEQQTLEAWQDLLTDFAGLDAVTGVLDREEALAQLRDLAEERTFAPEAADAPVQLLGLLEAAGLTFAGLWVTGLHDQAWPPPPRPNALLPLALQRELDLPHASPERELWAARRTTERLLASAPEVVLSWPRRADDQDLRPSPLIAAPPEPLREAPRRSDVRRAVEELCGQAPLERIADELGPPHPAATPIKGGTEVFRDQAACPFRAFARHRLGAADLARPTAAPDGRLRGGLVHAVLEEFWDAVRSSAQLRSLSAEERQRAVREAVERGLARGLARQAVRPGRAFLRREARRLERLLDRWLEVELGRSDFTVERIEGTLRFEVAGLAVEARLDRKDRLPDGGEVIVDYKTAKVSAAAWFGERPDEPQLPLYWLAARDEPIVAVTFAQLRPDGLRFDGVAARDGLGEGIARLEELRHRTRPADWDALTTGWRTALERLARAFLGGEAAVDPKRPPSTCEYCELLSLCRLHERTAIALRAETDDGPDEENGGRREG